MFLIYFFFLFFFAQKTKFILRLKIGEENTVRKTEIEREKKKFSIIPIVIRFSRVCWLGN